uniref:Putative coat protein n=1 Tax=Ilarvirus APLPV TaxID=134632 RepID=A0A5A4U6Q5_9BROM|nr:putative coat protein [American plum line pattern virus]
MLKMNAPQNKGKKKQNARTTQFAQRRAAAARGEIETSSRNITPARSGGPPVPRSIRTEWELVGPSVGARLIQGPHNEVVKGEAVASSTTAGQYFSIQISTYLEKFLEMGVQLNSMTVLCASLQGSGIVCLTHKFTTCEAAISTLSGLRFREGRRLGFQVLPPSDTVAGDVASNVRLVFKFDKAFEANAPLIERKVWVSTSRLPEIMIPANLLVPDED